MSSVPSLYLVIALAPLLGAILAGLFGTGFLGNFVSRRGSHLITIALMVVSAVGSFMVLADVLGGARFDGTLYTWSLLGQAKLEIGFLIDPLTALMMVVVSFVSLMVHVYTIGYMADDPGYQRFFAYISLFTFSMMMLVMSNNMVQLFFGWEAVGLVSYLLIGFWYTRPTAIFANMKAFVMNRVGVASEKLGTATPPIWVSTAAVRRKAMVGELNRSTSSIALGIKAGSWQIASHWSRWLNKAWNPLAMAFCEVSCEARATE